MHVVSTDVSPYLRTQLQTALLDAHCIRLIAWLIESWFTGVGSLVVGVSKSQVGVRPNELACHKALAS